jgi:hypothetical protein
MQQRPVVRHALVPGHPGTQSITSSSWSSCCLDANG